MQNRLSRATPRLPAAVTQQGVRVDKSRSNFLLFTILSSDDPDFDPVALGDYASRNVLPEIQRVPGVGQAQLFGTERAMRIWIDPAKLRRLQPVDQRRHQRHPGAERAGRRRARSATCPTSPGQAIVATVVVNGQLADVEQFGNIVLRANTDGSTVRLRDVARIELGGQSYATSARLNGKPSTGIGVQLSPTGNALATGAGGARRAWTSCQRYLPAGREVRRFPTTARASSRSRSRKVVETLIEAVVLVFLVMFLFLQNFRYTIIPTIVVPVALLGTFGVLLALGFSINVLTMFGMVLVIGIVVDDAIVVVENVERIMSEEGLPPREATRKAMGQISGAIIGVTVVLISVFVPLAFFAGSVGNIYRQFSAVMVASIGFSAFMALSLTPALCATLLKPVRGRPPPREDAASSAGSTAASRAPPRATKALVARMLQARRRAIWSSTWPSSAAVVLAVPARCRPPSCRSEDQGYIIVNVQLPPGATQERTLDGDGAGRGLHPQAARSAEHGRRARLQLLGPGPERRRWPSSR